MESQTAQAPAYTPDQVIAAGRTLLAEGQQPTRNSLHTKLGRRGDPLTAWRKWEEYLSGNPDQGMAIEIEGFELSADISSEIRKHHASLAAIIEAAIKEAVTPFQRKVAVLSDALGRETEKVEDLSELVSAQSCEIEQLRADAEEAERSVQENAFLRALIPDTAVRDALTKVPGPNRAGGKKKGPTTPDLPFE